MTLLKGKHSLLRYLGFIGAIFASLQALVWIGMYISGIVCFYTNCGKSQPGNRFGKAFHNIYLSTKLSQHYPHIIKPIILHTLLWFFAIVTVVWLVTSVSLIVDYRKWANAKRLRKSSKRWIVVTIIVCVLDLLLFVLFVVDFHMLKTGNIGASVRSTGDEDYDYGDFRPYDPHDPYDDYYDEDESPELFPVDNSTVPGAAEATSRSPLTIDERLHQIEETLRRKNADVDARIEHLIAQAKLIRETELGTHYNPFVRVKASKLVDELTVLEKLFKERERREEERNKIQAEKQTLKELMATSTQLGTAAVRKTEADEDFLSDQALQSDQAGPGAIPEQRDDDPESSENARRNFERIWTRIEEHMKYSDGAVHETETDTSGEIQANAGDEYDKIWRSTFQDDEYGIILQNDGPGTRWRKISGMNEGSATGSDVMLAPSAVLMTLAIRGYLLWIMNLSVALMLLYLYITRPRRPTLITRVQA